MLGRLVICLLLAALAATTAAAQGSDLVFAVTEGVTYQATPKEIRDKFSPLAQVLGKATGRRVRIVLVPAYDDLRAGLAKQEYDLAFVHPAHVAMAVVKSWTDKGGKVFARSRSVPIKQFIVASRVPPDQQGKLRDAMLGLRDAKGGREALDATGYKGFVAPNAEFERATIAWLGL